MAGERSSLLGYRKTVMAGVAALSALVPFAVQTSGALAGAPSSVRLAGSASSAATATPRVAGIDPASRITFDVNLALPDRAGAVAFARAVSSPGNPQYRHYLTASQWESRFSPSGARVTAVEAFLRQSGFTVSGVSGDRMTIAASGTASQVQRAFQTTLAYHLIGGKRLRVAERDLAVPASLGHIVLGVSGVNQVLAHPNSSVDSAARTPAVSSKNSGAAPGRFSRGPSVRHLLPPARRHHAAALRQRVSLTRPVGGVRLHAAAVPQRL